MISSLIMALQAAALSPQHAPSAPCQVAEVGPTEQAQASEGRILYVGCGQAAFRIGRVEDYRSSYNAAQGTLAVTVLAPGRTRVLVVRPAADGTVEVQDLSRDLAKMAGQPFNTELRAFDVDLGRFAADGTIAAAAKRQPASSARLTPEHYAPPAAERRQAPSGTPAEGSPR
jgi:hypothetical protein